MVRRSREYLYSGSLLNYELMNIRQTYNVLWATMEVYISKGLISASKVLDIRQVDVSSQRIFLSVYATVQFPFTDLHRKDAGE